VLRVERVFDLTENLQVIDNLIASAANPWGYRATAPLSALRWPSPRRSLFDDDLPRYRACSYRLRQYTSTLLAAGPWRRSRDVAAINRFCKVRNLQRQRRQHLFDMIVALCT
jgi:hypothetical protein